MSLDLFVLLVVVLLELLFPLAMAHFSPLSSTSERGDVWNTTLALQLLVLAKENRNDTSTVSERPHSMDTV